MCRLEVGCFHDTPSNNSRTNDAQIMHKLAKHSYRKYRVFGKPYLAKTNDLAVASCEHTFLRDITWNLAWFFLNWLKFLKVCKKSEKIENEAWESILKITKNAPVPELLFQWSFRLKPCNFIEKDSSAVLSVWICRSFHLQNGIL